MVFLGTCYSFQCLRSRVPHQSYLLKTECRGHAKFRYLEIWRFLDPQFSGSHYCVDYWPEINEDEGAGNE